MKTDNFEKKNVKASTVTQAVRKSGQQFVLKGQKMKVRLAAKNKLRVVDCMSKRK
jgi:hypothetical protein